MIQPIITADTELEAQCRDEQVCRGCNEPKDTGLVVCWNCYKYRTDIVPFKEFGGDLQTWFREFNLNNFNF